MRRDQLPPRPGHTFVLRREKVVYVSTPKVACTSLKSLIAQVGGEDLDSIGPDHIHNRKLWSRVPTLHELPDDELAGISGNNGWHIFAVVRHPTERLWSAWQNKLLLRVPRILDRTPEAYVPALPRSTGDVEQSFRRFVLGMAGGALDRLMRDPHFRPQQHVLAAGRMPYTRVYTIDELREVVADLEARLREAGSTPLPPLPASNSTPLRPLRSMFTDEVQAAIRHAYAADFRRWFPDEEIIPPGSLDADEYPANQLDEALRRAEENTPSGQGA